MFFYLVIRFLSWTQFFKNNIDTISQAEISFNNRISINAKPNLTIDLVIITTCLVLSLI